MGIKSWLEKDDIEIYSTHKEGKSVVVKILSKNVYIDKLDDMVYNYNNTYRSTIKTKPVDVKPSIYTESSKETINKDTKFKIDDIVRIPKYKTFLQKAMFQISLKKYF